MQKLFSLLSSEIFDVKDGGIGNLTTAGVIIICALICLLIAGAVVSYLVLRKTRHGNVITTKDVTYGAICLATSFALSWIGIRLPQGGTITFASTLPIMLYCYYFGFAKSAVVCSSYMLLQFFQEPYVVHPMSAVLDYVIPYMSLIFFGLFSYRQKRFNKVMAENKPPVLAHWPFLLGAVCYIAVRYTSHILSGIIFFAEYATGPVVAYSFAYNSFCLIDCAIAAALAACLFCSKTFNRFMASNGNTLQNSDSGTKDDKRTGAGADKR